MFQWKLFRRHRNKQNFCNMVHAWPKDYIKCDEHDVEPVHKNLSSSSGPLVVWGKSHLVKVI